VQTPDALIDQLLPDINQFHIFPFGGLKRTREWLDSRVGASTELEQTPILF
jgi:5,10-methylenetetrahydrofolate reductase